MAALAAHMPRLVLILEHDTWVSLGQATAWVEEQGVREGAK